MSTDEGDLRKALRDSEAKVEQLKTALVTLKAKSSEVQALCKDLQEEQARNVGLLEESKHREANLQRRCQDLEACVKQLEGKKSFNELEAAGKTIRPDHDVLQEIQQGLVRKRQAEGSNEDAVMQSAVSVCEGALGILKAALAGTLAGNQSDKSAPSQLLQHGRESNACLETQPIQDASPENRFRGQKRRAQQMEATAPATEQQAQSAIQTSGARLLDDDSGVAAPDIAQHWLAKLTQGSVTQETIEETAEGLYHELKVSRRCPRQCMATCTVLSIAHCSNSFGSLQANDEDSSTGSSSEPYLQIGMAVEDLPFSRFWCDHESRSIGAFTNVVACVTSLDVRHDQSSEPLSFSAAVEDELRRCLLIDHADRGCATTAEDCAMMSALFLLLRTRGNMQAARVFLVDLLTSSPGRPEACLPCLTAALATWPDILCPASSSSSSRIEDLLQEGLQMLCRRVMHDMVALDEDANTSAGSISGTTMAAAARSSLGIAADHLQQIGRSIWGWSDSSGTPHKEAGRDALHEWGNRCLEELLRAAAAGDAGSTTLCCNLCASFIGLSWTCQQVLSSILLSKPGTVLESKQQDPASVAQLIDNLLDISELSGFWDSIPEESNVLEAFKQAAKLETCPQSARSRLQNLFKTHSIASA